MMTFLEFAKALKTLTTSGRLRYRWGDDDFGTVTGFGYTDYMVVNRWPHSRPYVGLSRKWTDGVRVEDRAAFLTRGYGAGFWMDGDYLSIENEGGAIEPVSSDRVIEAWLLTATSRELPLRIIARGPESKILALADRSAWNRRKHRYHLKGPLTASFPSFEKAYARASKIDPEQVDFIELTEDELNAAEVVDGKPIG